MVKLVSSGNSRQDSSNASVMNFVLEFLNVHQKVTKPYFEDMLLMALVISRQKYVIRFSLKVSVYYFTISEQ